MDNAQRLQFILGGMPSAYNRAKQQQIEDEEKKRYEEQMQIQREANAWEEEQSPDLLQTLLGLGTTAGGIASLFGGPLAAAAPGLIGAGVGMTAGGLGKKRARNRLTGRTSGGGLSFGDAAMGAQIGTQFGNLLGKGK